MRLVATHGNVIASVGTCPTCGRHDVALITNGTCADLFACLAAYSLLRSPRRR